MRKLSWTPKRAGGVYCSPACGHECTYSEYLRAKLGAEVLVRRLGGGKWKARVWENLGWHYSAVKGLLRVYPSGRQYTASCDNRRGSYGNTPLKAVAAAIAVVQQEAEALQQELAEIT